ncbi:MAG: prephenate dehydrogenase/arogenate dehydrogenase family protein [Bradymonadaceae bacterium]|nr:prephenate dehydrogenase/arogenate dehydrogenase family protein [Lujinxingiaceae bacterium]
MAEDLLTALRDELNGVDEELVRLVGRRQHLVAEIGRTKQQSGRGTRDYAREKVVVERARALATELGIDPGAVAALFEGLIRASLAVQERDRIVQRAGGLGRPVLVIGGAGLMGRWFTSFLDAQGYHVTIADPGGPVEGFASVDDWATLDLDAFYMVLVATPMRAANDILEALALRSPSAIVLEISSLKEPVRPGLDSLVKAGVAVASLHPMFGPGVDLLSGRHVVLIDLGHKPALEAARALFEDTMATLVEMELEQHDRAMAFVLGLSHAINIVFGDTLARSGHRAERLGEVSSTTFARQLAVAGEVAHENPHLYFEIQALNPNTIDVLDALSESVDRLRRQIAEGAQPEFVAMMEGRREFLRARAERMKG